MDKDEKKLDEETEQTEAEKQDKPADEQKKEPPEDDKPEDEKATDDKQADENGEGADADDMPEETAKEEKAPEAPQLSETDQLKAENLTLKTQLEAMKIGFAPDYMEDAVILAEAIVKREGCDISAALQAVAKKYPDWKSDSKDKAKSGGFRIGASSGKQDNVKLDVKQNTAQKRWNRFN